MSASPSLTPAIRIRTERHLAEVGFFGDVDLDALMATSRQISAHASFRRGMDTLADFTRAALRLSYDDMDRFRDYVWSLEALRGPCRWAAVAPNAPSRESVALFAAMAEAFELRIQVRHFYAADAALHWLGG